MYLAISNLYAKDCHYWTCLSECWYMCSWLPIKDHLQVSFTDKKGWFSLVRLHSHIIAVAYYKRGKKTFLARMITEEANYYESDVMVQQNNGGLLGYIIKTHVFCPWRWGVGWIRWCRRRWPERCTLCHSTDWGSAGCLHHPLQTSLEPDLTLRTERRQEMKTIWVNLQKKQNKCCLFSWK